VQPAVTFRQVVGPADGFYEWTKSPAEGGKDP
jgi:putative SOS response-associated peptidase YedK